VLLEEVEGSITALVGTCNDFLKKITSRFRKKACRHLNKFMIGMDLDLRFDLSYK
jgi:hypothetical protein